MKTDRDKRSLIASCESAHERETTTGDALMGTPWFSLLPEREQKALLAEVREVVVPAGGCLLRVGEMPRGWFGVMEGILKWTALGEDGRSVSIAGLSAGSWFGEASLVRAQPYGYHVFALRCSRLVVIPQETCDRLLLEQIVFARAVMRHLAERVNLFMATFTAQVLANMEVKTARTLASMFHKELHPRTQLHLRISQEELANLCGISRQRCNRVLKKLHELKLIDVGYAGITVLDLEGLRQFNDAGVCLPPGT
jgi:CRP-like cAMP-binding protein